MGGPNEDSGLEVSSERDSHKRTGRELTRNHQEVLW